MPAVIFDFDGLVIDSEPEMAMCVIDALAARGFTLVIEEFGHLFGSTENDHLWDDLLTAGCGGEVTVAQLDAELMQVLPARLDALPLLPGVAEVLDAARRSGWAAALATGQERSRLDPHLARLGLADRFDTIVTARDVALGKPAPDIYLEHQQWGSAA